MSADEIEKMNREFCPRIKHILQVRLSKDFLYSFPLAEQAVTNSVLMAYTGRVEHFLSSQNGAAEVVTACFMNKDEESVLQRIVDCWQSSPDGHWELLERYNVIGIGVARSDKGILYATARLKR